MDDILYVKADQVVFTDRNNLTLEDVVTLYCRNKSVIKKLNQEFFYKLENKKDSSTAFTLLKVYEVIHRVYPEIQIENVGERDFIVEYSIKRNQKPSWEWIKVFFVCLVLFFGAAFTIMTFNEDVNVSKVFEKVYALIMGQKKNGGSLLELSYCIGLPLGILVFYNHFFRRKRKNDPTPIQVEMRTYEEQIGKAMIRTSSREGNTIDVN